MHENIKISVRQLTFLAVFITVGDSIIVLPAIPAMYAHRDAWISAILGMAIGLATVLLYIKVGKIYPKLNFLELNRTIFGKFLGTIMIVIFLAYALLNICTVLRGVGDFSVSQIMPDTPVEAIFVLLILLVIMGVRLGLETIARVSEIFFPWFILLFGVLVFSLLPNINIHNIQPVFDNGFKPVIQGAITCATFPFLELLILISVFPHVNDQEKIGKGIFIGAIIGGVILVITIALTILVMGAGSSSTLLYPGYDLAKRISIGDFFKRIEAVLALLWVITIFFKMSMFLYVFAQGLSQLLKLKEYRMLLFPIGMAIVVLSLAISPNIIYFNKVLVEYWSYLDISVSLCIPILLLIVYMFRKKVLSERSILEE